MEETIEQFVNEPSGDACAAYGGHLLGKVGRCVFIDSGSEPGRYRAPFTANIKGEVVDCAVQTGEAIDVFIVVEGGSGLGQALMGECILELLDLGFFVEVVFFDFTIFVLWGGLDIVISIYSNVRKHSERKEVTYVIHHVEPQAGRTLGLTSRLATYSAVGYSGPVH